MKSNIRYLLRLLIPLASIATAADFHLAPDGHDANPGTAGKLLDVDCTAQDKPAGDNTFDIPVATGIPASEITTPASRSYSSNQMPVRLIDCSGPNDPSNDNQKCVESKEVAAAAPPFPSAIKCLPQPVYRHRPDGSPGREITFNLGAYAPASFILN